jgi:hypothetical protein
VSSRLHQQRIARAMQRQMLGLGREPSAPSGVTCGGAGGGSGGGGAVRVAVAWAAPAEPGQPHFHKLQLQRLAAGAAPAGASWEAVADVEAEAVPSWTDEVGAAGHGAGWGL